MAVIAPPSRTGPAKHQHLPERIIMTRTAHMQLAIPPRNFRSKASAIGAFLALAGALAATPAHAALVVFSSQSAFQTATGATSATGALPNLGYVGTAPTTIGSITFVSASNANGLWVGGLSWSTLIPHAIAVDSSENFNVISNSGVFAMGIQAHEPSHSGTGTDHCWVSPSCTDTTFSITIKNGTTTIGSQSVNFADDTLSFFGIWSDQAFDRFEIRDTSNAVDDEFFGQVYTSNTAYAAAVPEPGSLPLLGLSFAALGLARRLSSNHMRGQAQA